MADRTEISSDHSSISPTVLECFPTPYPDVAKSIRHEAFEFSHLCPFTGQPDTGHLLIEFTPTDKCVELKSLKLYLHQYRNCRISYEAVSSLALQHLSQAMQPSHIRVTVSMQGRGGIRSKVSVERGSV